MAILGRLIPALPVLLMLLLSGCASVRQGALDTGAALTGRVLAPEQVAALDYGQIRGLDALRDECLVLADVQRRRGYIKQTDLEWLVPQCENIIASEQARIAEEQAIAEFIAREWAVLQHRLEQIRREEARQRRQQEAIARETQAREEAVFMLREAIAGALIQRELADNGVQNKPLAHTQGQPVEISLNTFLACVELAYPNAGYRISRNARNLTVVAVRARLPRGEMPIEARFIEYPNSWLLNYLKVADIEPRTAADRYVLAENLLAERCHSEAGLFDETLND